jgi:hypothetical protein
MCCKVCIGSTPPVGYHWTEVPTCDVWRGWPPPCGATFVIPMLATSAGVAVMVATAGAGMATWLLLPVSSGRWHLCQERGSSLRGLEWSSSDYEALRCWQNLHSHGYLILFGFVSHVYSRGQELTYKGFSLACKLASRWMIRHGLVWQVMSS